MKRYVIHIFFLSSFFFLLTYNYAIANKLDELIEGSFEETEKTLYILDKIFHSNQSTFLNDISSIDFINSEWFEIFKNYANKASINFNHSIEFCKKEFILNNDERKKLIIMFEKNNKTKNWHMIDAYKLIKGIKIEFKAKGFSPLSVTRNFQDLLVKINTPEMSDYLGLVNNGILNTKFLKENKLGLSKNAEILIKDIIIYNGNNIIDLIYITLKYYPIGRKENNKYKGGWLLKDAGSMSDLYENNLYINFLLKKITPNTLKLNQPNEFIYTPNIRDITSHETAIPDTIQNTSDDTINELHNKRYRLNIYTNVYKPSIRIMNIKPKFKQGILLVPGKYDIEVSKQGFNTVRKWITITNSNKTFNVDLIRK